MCEGNPLTKIFTFDLKGSTVDRDVIKSDNLKILKTGNEADKSKIIEKFSKEVLKDKDFTNLDLKFKLSKKDADCLRKMIRSDSELLRLSCVTDYSLFVTIHKYSAEDLENKSYRVMASSDKKYIFSISIIDYLGVIST